MRSGIYIGQVMHSRLAPVQHRFVYRVFSIYVDLDELPALAKRLRLFSLNRFNLFAFRDGDHGEGREAAKDWAARRLREAGIPWDGGRIGVLCFPRILGIVFNPLSVWFCHDRAGRLVALIHEVHNTFGDRHSYVLPVRPGDAERGVIAQACGKDFYVSPFIQMEAGYAFRVKPPGETVSVLIRERADGQEILRATLSGKRAAFTDATLARLFVTHPLMTLKVIAAIHWQALRLIAKGARFYPRGRLGAALAKRLNRSVQ